MVKKMKYLWFSGRSRDRLWVVRWCSHMTDFSSWDQGDRREQGGMRKSRSISREKGSLKRSRTEERQTGVQRQTYGQTQNPLERHRFHKIRKQEAEGPLDHFKLPEYFREMV